MAIAIVQEFEGATLDQYDEVVRRMGFTPGGAGPPGSLFHWVTETDGSIVVTDVWVSKEAFDAFAEAQIGPITADVGIPGAPEITYHEVHNHHTAG
jgi:hypothetical protein